MKAGRKDGKRDGVMHSSAHVAVGKAIDVDDAVVIIADGEEASPEAVKPEEIVAHAKLGVRELKDLLTAAGVSFAGATEKEDLVRLLSKARAQAAASDGKFIATDVWQRVPDGIALPTGLEVKFDLKLGCNYARLLPTADCLLKVNE